MLAFYDLNCSPTSFDILHFLIAAQYQAQGEHVHVVIVPGKIGGFRPTDHKPLSNEEKEWRVRHVLVPSCHLAGCSVTVAPTREFADTFSQDGAFPPGYRVSMPRSWYTFGIALKLCREGFRPTFKSSVRAKQHAARVTSDRYVTLTLRQTHTPTRNSNVPAWHELAKHIESRGYQVVMIPDTEEMMGQANGLFACDLDLRMALYEEAVLNMSSSGGPFMLNLFAGLPYVFFYDVNLPAYIENGKKHWRPTAEYTANMGLPVGDQYPVGGGKIVWASDNAETLIKEFDEVIGV